MSDCKITLVRHQERNLGLTTERFSIGSSNPCADADDKLNIAEFGLNLVDGTLEIGINGKIFQIPSLEALAANDGQSTVWNEANKKYVFGVGNRIENVLNISDLKVAGEVQLTKEQSGSIIIMDEDATVRLPTTELGLNFRFRSNNEVSPPSVFIRTTGGDFQGGVLSNDIDSIATPAVFFTVEDENQMELNGTTQGGNRGTWVDVVVFGGDWDLTGFLNCSGVVADPF